MECDSDLLDASLSSDSLKIAHRITGHVAKKLFTRFKWDRYISLTL